MLTFTDRAALRITMNGSPLAPRFDLTLVSEGERRDGERELDLGDFVVLVADAQAHRLEGATVDFVERVNESGFEVRTIPPKPGEGPAGSSRLTGPIADKVRTVLDTEVNPAIASHGGQISLVDVQDTEVYVEMSGGCQGCAMSRLTLRQGVERMLRQAVPELTAVHDVTDHDSGTNPFFEHPV
jgi:Fe/S biogenesis protein NfuA